MGATSAQKLALKNVFDGLDKVRDPKARKRMEQERSEAFMNLHKSPRINPVVWANELLQERGSHIALELSKKFYLSAQQLTSTEGKGFAIFYYNALGYLTNKLSNK
jgi:hypothetical protein